MTEAKLVMKKIWVFFYGTFMSTRVLQEYGISCKETLPARLNGYELSIRPRVNLEENDASVAYGGLAFISPENISRLYECLRKTFGLTYAPCQVTVERIDGSLQPALCYIASDVQYAMAEKEYVLELVRCAVELEAPEPYIEHIKSFL